MNEMTQGAASGAMFGPIGAAVGGGAGLFSDLEKRKQMKAMRPKNRRMTEIQNALTAYREQKVAGQMTMAQSAFDWANSLRI